MIERAALRTARLRLEPIGPAHADDLWRATEASLPELRPWLFWAADVDLGSTRGFTESAVEEWDQGLAYHFAIRDETGLAGAMGVEVPVPVRRLGELGYWVATDRAGRGYATEAGAIILGFAFDTIDLYRLELRTGVDNRASQRVAEKLGFRLEGTLRKGCPLADGAYDGYLYGLLAVDARPG